MITPSIPNPILMAMISNPTNNPALMHDVSPITIPYITPITGPM